ncbi:natural killer cell receptor 2B4-like isoform X3 [Alosa sapidissima]|uniref:natural killer cell receptor 2B4-like isoform X2 n=1 Tax=Alosa sapidissima TaxID=34773 RepID=UPI001C0A3002|nr:natural killer cell receptor 2B4-like isoform X2 [Alosa sapidissima]XP_041928588.1 natural killer cell receptor 2B4-like isoform X3 [Alosa sapidissima]
MNRPVAWSHQTEINRDRRLYGIFWVVMFLLLVIGLMSTTGPAVSAAELLVLEGGSVTLNVTGHEDKHDLKRMSWSFYEQEIVVYSHKNSDVDYDCVYEARMEFDVNTFSLRLKNLQKTDSGLYKAEKALHGKQKETVAEYRIYVLEPAAAPTLTVVSNWSSSDSCSVTLNCTGLNVSLISSCNGIVCSQEEGVTSLSISLNHSTVSCNHSNPVSWSQATMDLKPLCPLYRDDLAPPAGMSPCLLKALLVTVAMLL